MRHLARPAAPLVDDRWLVRPRLFAMLADRWDARVTTLVAGAGFGKTTLIAQALAENRLAPRGQDRWLGCTPADAAASTLVTGLAEALDLKPPQGRDRELSWLLEASWGLPLGTCLVLDDVHEIPAGSEGELALGRLVRELPSQLSLVLAGRQPVGVPLARLRTQGAVVDVDEDMLRFTSEEASELARRRGTDPDNVADLGGWPALVALAIHAGRRGAGSFAFEEVVSGLVPTIRRQLALVAAAGGGDREVLDAAAGEPVDAVALAALPLVRLNDGALRVHALWADLLAEELAADERAGAQRRAGRVWLARGDHDTAITLFAAAGDADALCEAVADACHRGYAGPKPDVLMNWRTLLPKGLDDRPEAILLDGVAARATDPFGTTAVDLLQRAAAGFATRGVVGGEVSALSELAYVLRSRGEYDRIPAIMARLFALEAAGAREVEGPVRLARVLLAEQLDDDESMLRELAGIPPDALSREWWALVEWLRSSSLLLLGRPADAVAAAKRCVQLAGPEYLGGRYALLLTRWWHEPTSELVESLPFADDEPGTTPVDRLMTGALAGLLMAFADRTDDARRNLALGQRAATPDARPELLGLLALAEAAAEVAGDDEPTAVKVLEAFFDGVGPAGARVARRAPGLVQVLVGDAAFSGKQLGPAVEGCAAAGRLLVALRTGAAAAPADLLGATRWILQALPVPWAVELAVRLHPTQPSTAEAVLRQVLAVYPVRGRDRLRRLREDGSPLRDEARAVLARLPLPPERPVQIRLLGPTDVVHADRAGATTALKRERVRHMLAFLALHPSATRDEVADALWPGLDVEAGRRNLRVNLSHLQRVLEPDRLAGDAPFVLHQDASRLELAGPPWIEIDIDAFERLTAAAETDDRAGAHRRSLERMESALELVHGAPLADVRHEEWARQAALYLTARVARVAVRAASLRHALGDHDQAIVLGFRALDAEPWSEPAFRVIAAAHHAQGDRVAALRVLTECRDRLAELGVEPDGQTKAVERRVRGET